MSHRFRRLALPAALVLTALGAGQPAGWTAQAADGPADPAAAFALKGQLTQGGWARGVAPRDAVSVSFNGNKVQLDGDGGFFIAFDRDAPAQARLTAELRGGGASQADLKIAPRAWKIEHIPLGPRPGAPPNEDYVRRREAELAQISAARRLHHDSAGWRQKFIWPVMGRLSGRFGSQRIYNGRPGAYHSGLDIATGASGTPFVAPADGVVILAAQSPFSLEGRLLMIDHGMGLNSAFLHCSKLAVKLGDVVRQGQYIGSIGMTGRATGPHLHWSLKWRDSRLDPLLFAGAMPTR